LREPDKTLDDLLTMGRALEMADAQSLTMERDSVAKIICLAFSRAFNRMWKLSTTVTT
jgi:hypothetical protein